VDDFAPVVQRVLFSGRYQHDFVTVHADEGRLDASNVRRMRLGLRVVLLRTFTLHGEVDLNPQERDPLYVRTTDLYLQWSRNPRLVLTVGKHSAPFTLDGATSSKELLAIDRSNLANNLWFPQEYLPGFAVSGRQARWTYRAGVYSAGAANREFGEFNGGPVGLAVIGYDFAPALGVGEALLSGSYVYQRPDEDNSFTLPLEHAGSAAFRFGVGRMGVWADVSAASGYLGQADVWGATVMPYFRATDRLQFVGRYTELRSDEENGVRLNTYENRVAAGRGDRYREFYAGANYFFYGHKLKVQSGVQVADMDDRSGDGGAYSGVSWTTGVRVGW
jgi:phosphate-selective porin OprO/OprP